jgi:hypothetical protein
MSNELPQAPTEMCEPVITGSNYVGQEMSVKDLKLISKLYFGYYRVGRIKRMRNPIHKHRWPNIYKRIGRKRYVTILRMDDDVFEKTMFTITRWNRH